MKSQNDYFEIFSALVERGEPSINVAAAWAEMTSAIKGSVETDAILVQLGELKQEVRDYVGSTDEDIRARLNRINRFFVEVAGFQGDPDLYVDPAYRYLDDVLRTRKGIPISLSILFTELAAVCDLEVDPIAFPGHFLVRERSEEILCDPFSGRVGLGQTDCMAIAAGIFGKEIVWDDDYLAVATKTQVLQRILFDFRASFEGNGDKERLAITETFIEKMRTLEPLATEVPIN